MAYKDKVIKLRKELGFGEDLFIPDLSEGLNLRTLEELFYEAKRQNDLKLMGFTIKVLARYCREVWRVQSARTDALAMRTVNVRLIYADAFKDLSIKEEEAQGLSLMMDLWGKDSLPTYLSDEREPKDNMRIHYCLENGFLITEELTLHPGPSFPGQFTQFANFFEENLKKVFGSGWRSPKGRSK